MLMLRAPLSWRRRSFASCMSAAGRTTSDTVARNAFDILIVLPEAVAAAAALDHAGRGTCFFKDGQFFQGDWTQATTARICKDQKPRPVKSLAFPGQDERPGPASIQQWLAPECTSRL